MSGPLLATLKSRHSLSRPSLEEKNNNNKAENDICHAGLSLSVRGYEKKSTMEAITDNRGATIVGSLVGKGEGGRGEQRSICP